MNKRFLYVVAFAVVMSGMVSLLIYRMVMTRVGAASSPAKGRIVVATHDLALGTLIRDADITIADWNGAVPANALLTKEAAIGRGVVAAIYEKEPVLESRLAPQGAGAGLAAMIPKGMRAVAVHVNEVVGVAGFVVPGMRVDVLVSGNPPGSRNETGTQTRTVLQNIEVLSAGQNIQKDAEGKPVSVAVVNVAVTPEQAEILSLAGNETKIQLVLRNPLDGEQVKTPGTAVARLFSGNAAEPVRPAPSAPRRPVVRPKTQASAPPAAPPAPQFKVVEVFFGVKKADVKFQKDPEVKP
jgi:pilus assembly protein CpaB